MLWDEAYVATRFSDVPQVIALRCAEGRKYLRELEDVWYDIAISPKFLVTYLLRKVSPS